MQPSRGRRRQFRAARGDAQSDGRAVGNGRCQSGDLGLVGVRGTEIGGDREVEQAADRAVAIHGGPVGLIQLLCIRSGTFLHQQRFGKLIGIESDRDASVGGPYKRTAVGSAPRGCLDGNLEHEAPGGRHCHGRLCLHNAVEPQSGPREGTGDSEAGINRDPFERDVGQRQRSVHERGGSVGEHDLHKVCRGRR